MDCCGRQSPCCQTAKPHSFSEKALLTIGMPCYDDFDGVFFSTQALLLYHKEAMPYIRLMVLDNNPSSKQGKETEDYCKQLGITYLPFSDYHATTVKGLIFENAETPFVLCMDSHVLLEPGSLTKLLMYYQCNENSEDLLHGPLLSEEPNRSTVWTHMEPRWRNQMYGVWAADDRGQNPTDKPFEIPMQGMGVFSCRKDAWVGFNKNFRGFGGEEWYIHEKFRKRGGRVMCLPFLRWAHRFRRPRGIPYKLFYEEKIRNYYIGFLELGLDVSTITNHFKHEHGFSDDLLDHILFDAKCSLMSEQLP